MGKWSIPLPVELDVLSVSVAFYFMHQGKRHRDMAPGNGHPRIIPRTTSVPTQEPFLHKFQHEQHLGSHTSWHLQVLKAGNIAYVDKSFHRNNTRLETLDLSSNRLNGSIPEEISNLYGLVHLDLSANSFSGPIPAAFSHLHRLSKLSLAFNNLNGTIPVEFEQQLHLEDIDVSHNQLSGDIWETFYALRANLTLSICSNHLSGRIPENLVNNRFPNGCFDRENLCSSVPTLGLPRCESDSCSDYALQGQKSCKSMPSKRKKIIITCSAIAGAVIGVVILLAVFRLGMERRTVNDRDDDVSMISYQRLEFNKWEVLAGLIDENLVGNGGSAKVYKVMTRRGQILAVKSIRHQVMQGHMLEKQFLAEK
ncbi:hypothetical protein DM860_004234 [Cuscuta australis]|uniref:Protein kinase domain-containing protein n=1 Tax=Cuscuta australis TaxID=267555 RepID=A0A328EB20_9ASTE|nr:hypothetical protein DM860_004234 [Cuscuta australis]